MSERKLQGLEPESVFRYFEEICAIPHGSRNTKSISDYLVSFAKAHGLRYRQDESNNVVIFAPGTCGLEDHESVILQGHMDMVCEKDAGCPLDMAVDGLDVTHDGCCIFAKGTTLGGDDGIAVAYALAILDDNTIAHPPLEVIITVDEEIGMLGAAAMDLADVKGRTMLNLDSEDEGIFTVSCAGGATCTVSLNAERKAVYGPCVRLSVEGLRGGHSGAEIDKGRANANLLLGRVLNAVQCKLSFRLVSAAGGLKDNAIPNAAEAVLALREEDMPAAREIAAACEADFRKEYAAADPGVTVALEPAPACDQALTEEATLRVVRFLLLVPNGIAAMSMDIPGLVQTSCNLGIFHVTDSVLTAVSSVRSSVSSQKQMLLARIDALSQLLGGSLHVTGAYPAWEYRRESPLRDKLAAVYTQQTGKTPKIEAIHAGLECGLFAGQLPGLDCVSFGPDLVDIHTTREKMSISSVQRTWRFLLGALEALKN